MFETEKRQGCRALPTARGAMEDHDVVLAKYFFGTIASAHRNDNPPEALSLDRAERYEAKIPPPTTALRAADALCARTVASCYVPGVELAGDVETP